MKKSNTNIMIHSDVKKRLMKVKSFLYSQNIKTYSDLIMFLILYYLNNIKDKKIKEVVLNDV